MAKIPDHEREILEFLARLEGDARYERRAKLMKNLSGFDSHGPGGLLLTTAKEPITGDAIDALQCDPGDVADLATRGYVSGVTTAAGPKVDPVGLTPQGWELIERNFEELPVSAPGSQTISITGGQFGNANIGVQGSASISGSPVAQGGQDLRQLLDDLKRAIDESAVPEEDKTEAKLDAAQLQLELERPRKNGERILEYLKAIPATLKGATAVVTAVSHLEEALRSQQWLD